MVRRGLRIAVASSGLGHVARGIEAWAADLGRALADRGETVRLCKGGGEAQSDYEVVIPCWQRHAARTEQLRRWLPPRAVWRFGVGTDYGLEQLTFAWNLVRWLRRWRADILHVQDAQVARIVQRARRLGLLQTATILAHGTNEPWHYLAGFRYLQHLAPWHLEQAATAGFYRDTWTAIPNFIDTDTFCPGSSDALKAELGIPQDHLVVVTAAAIKREHKRIDYLLEEFARLRNHSPDLPATLVVAGGKEPETDELVALGRKLLGDRVRFLVGFPRTRMSELYRLADVFVLCSLREMMPVALLEATASGLPCVVHEHPIMKWMTGPGGQASDLTLPGNLATNLRELLADPRRRQELGRQARGHCQGVFSRDQVVNRILDYYRFAHADNRRLRPRRRPQERLVAIPA